MNQPAITRGSRVKFDLDGSTVTGTVFNITTDIGNGRKMANVELEHELPGVIKTVPFDSLAAAPLSQTTIFMSGGSADYLTPDVGNRRFTVISIDSKRAS